MGVSGSACIGPSVGGTGNASREALQIGHVFVTIGCTSEKKNYVEVPRSGGSGRNGRLLVATLDWLPMFLIFWTLQFMRGDKQEVVDRDNILKVRKWGYMRKWVDRIVYQLSNYNYTFPLGPARSHPYCNDQIINAIRDLYFSGGHMSFASHCSSHFPSCDHCDNVTRREVPVPMVALVATVLYAVLFEWHSGKQDVEDFSANSYLDVYLGHIETLREILTQQSGAFHSMMADIYSKASTMPASTGSSSGVQTVELNFEELKD
ncbi:hypothetical protein V8E53_008580 [Lactarius tabidus]